MSNPFGPALAQIRKNWAVYLLLNVLFYGLILAGFAYAFARPDIQRQLLSSVIQGFNSGPLSYARDAYLSRDFPAAVAITFGVNTFIGSFATLTLPSLLIPFFGSFFGLLRALVLGATLAPSTPELARAMVPHIPVILVECQGYILAMLGVHILWSSAFGGLRDGGSGFVHGYIAGLKANLRIYVLIVAVLAIAAIYEAIELIYLVAPR